MTTPVAASQATQAVAMPQASLAHRLLQVLVHPAPVHLCYTRNPLHPYDPPQCTSHPGPRGVPGLLPLHDEPRHRGGLHLQRAPGRPPPHALDILDRQVRPISIPWPLVLHLLHGAPPYAPSLELHPSPRASKGSTAAQYQANLKKVYTVSTAQVLHLHLPLHLPLPLH